MSDVALDAAPAGPPRGGRHGAGFWAYLTASTLLAVVFVLPLVWAVARLTRSALSSSTARDAQHVPGSPCR